MKHTNACGIGSATAIYVFGVQNTSADQEFNFILDHRGASIFSVPSSISGVLNSTLLYSASPLNTHSTSRTLVIQDIRGNMLFQSLEYT